MVEYPQEDIDPSRLCSSWMVWDCEFCNNIVAGEFISMGALDELIGEVRVDKEYLNKYGEEFCVDMMMHSLKRDLYDYMEHWDTLRLVINSIKMEKAFDKVYNAWIYVFTIQFHWFPTCRYDEWGEYNE